MPYKFKLTRPGGETRRLTFNSRPTWDELDSKIASLFSIPLKAVAVSYQDSDGDTVTMSTQEELYEYLTSGLKFSEPIKFAVVDKSQAIQHTRSVLGTETEAGLPTIGPTIVYDIEDSSWQRVAPIYAEDKQNLNTGSNETHAFVEVIDSDSENENEPQSTYRTSVGGGMSSRQQRFKGKGRDINPQTGATKSDSSLSIVDGEVSDQERPGMFGFHRVIDKYLCSYCYTHVGRDMGYGNTPSSKNILNSFGTVYVVSPPADAVKVPRNFDIPPSLPAHSEFTQSIQGTPRPTIPVDIQQHSDVHSHPVSQSPSFSRDVAKLVDDLSAAFESHPELSEGIRNIVKNAVNGSYWSTDRNRSTSLAESVRVVAEETSEHITRAVGTMANNAEQEAVHMIAEALGGVFRVIGELSHTGGRSVLGGRHPHPHAHHHHYGPRGGWHGARAGSPPPGPPPQGPPPPPGPPPPGPPNHPGPPPPHTSHSHLPPPPPPPHMSPDHPAPPPRMAHDHPPPPGTFGRPSFPGPQDPFSHYPRIPGYPGAPGHFYGPPPVAPPGFGSNFPHERGHFYGRGWGGMHHQLNSYDWMFRDGINQDGQANIHETKASLEAAKSAYKAEKERFRQEKEYRRKIRKERAEQRMEERVASSA